MYFRTVHTQFSRVDCVSAGLQVAFHLPVQTGRLDRFHNTLLRLVLVQGTRAIYDTITSGGRKYDMSQ